MMILATIMRMVGGDNNYPKTSLFVRKLDVTDDNNGQDNHADEDLDDLDDGWVGIIRAPGALRLGTLL